MPLKSILIATKLRMLTLVGVVTIVLIGSFGLYQLSRVDVASREIRSNWMPSIQYLGEANAALANHRMKTYKHIMLTDSEKMSIEEAEMQKLIVEAKRNLDDYRDLAFTDFEKREFKMLGEHLANYASINSRIIDFSRQNLYDSARTIMYTKSFEDYTALSKTIKKLLAFNIQQSQLTTAKSESVFKNAIAFTIGLLLIGSLTMMGMGRWILKGIKNQLGYLKSIFEKLSLGDVNVSLQTNSSDEIGQLSKNISQVIVNLQSASDFSKKIGEGDLNSKLQVLSAQDRLGISLNNMQSQLKWMAEEDRKRIWATEGLARLGEILSTQHDNSQILYDELIKFVAKYTNSLQGGMFLYNEDSQLIELVSCYAYDRKKFLHKTVEPGVGVLGQVFLEKHTQYLLEVPKDYVTITSGLGMANPTSVLIVPLKANDLVLGVMELASFKKFEEYRISFLEKLGESIASAVASIRANERTKQLLETSLQQSEEMRAHEEEVLQNMEELSATQEEMVRQQVETDSVIKAIDSSFAVVEFEPDGTILNANKNFLDLMGYQLGEVKNHHHRMFVSPEEQVSEEYARFWKNLAKGNEFKGNFKRVNKRGEPVWINGNYSPMRNANGEVKKIMKIAFDITSFSMAEITYNQTIERLESELAKLSTNTHSEEMADHLIAENRNTGHIKMEYSKSTQGNRF